MSTNVYFTKYHGMGNDYIIVDPNKNKHITYMSPTLIQQICDRNYGAGSDGIVFGPLPDMHNKHTLCMVRLYNPDGSEFEKTGNGLRIICQYLYDEYRTLYNIKLNKEFYIKLFKTSEIIKAKIIVSMNNNTIKVEIGHARHDPLSIPCTNTQCNEVLKQKMVINVKNNDLSVIYSCVNVGNPHCVVLLDDLRKELNVQKLDPVKWTKKLGPLIENNMDLFPQRINVQFMDIIDNENIKIYIWERGVGYTLSSGTCSCAASVIAYKLGLIKSKRINVNTDGGVLLVEINNNEKNLFVTLTAPVTKVCEGNVYIDSNYKMISRL